MNGQHLATAKFSKGAERKRQQMVEEEMQKSVERSFQAYRRPLKTVISFKYLWRVLTVADEN